MGSASLITRTETGDDGRAIITAAGDIDLWLRPLVPLDLIPEENIDRLILGARNRSAAARVEQRFVGDIEHALAALMGRPVTIAVTLVHDWLDERSSAPA